MILFVITGAAPPILVLTLLVMAYLTGAELWKEGETVPFLVKAWWALFVLLFNVVGFGIFWIWLARRRLRAAKAP